jgi:hypothetical protein
VKADGGLCRHGYACGWLAIICVCKSSKPELSLQLSQNVITLYKDTLSQQLVGYYTTHQPDGVHIEARCTCEVKYEGVGHREIRR